MLSELRKLLDANQYNDIIILCDNFISKYNLTSDKKQEITNLYFYKGVANFFAENFKGAQKDFSQAINLKSNISTFYYWRGKTKYYLNQFEDAICDFDKAINEYLVEFTTDISHYFEMRGLAKYNLCKYEESLVDIEIALELEPNNNHYHKIKGFCICEMQQKQQLNLFDIETKKLEKSFENVEVIEFQIKDGTFYYNRAIQCYNETVQPSYSRYDCQYLCSREICQEVLEDLTKAINLEPDNEAWLSFIKQYEKDLISMKIIHKDK